MSRILRLSLFALTLSPAIQPLAAKEKPAAPAKAVVRKVELEGAKLEFTAQSVDQATGKSSKPDSGLSLYQGQLWYGCTGALPRLVMKTGTCEIDGQKIPLDVTGLGDPWVDRDLLERRFVKLTPYPHGEKQPADFRISVVFAKGGAEDYLVEWEISHGKSLRVTIASLGDTYPDWVKAK